jgi:hypothetical protein
MQFEFGICLIGILSLLTIPRKQMLWSITLIAGAVIEISATSFSAAFSGAGLVALSSAALARRKSAVVYILFASIFLLLLCGAILASHARTENLALLRVELGSMTPSLASAIIPLVWIGLMLRIAVLPLWLPHITGVGAALTVGPGWLSALVFAEHVAAMWPQSILIGCTSLCVSASGLYALLMGLATIRGRRDGGWMGFVASGVGMVALTSVWFGAEAGPLWGRDLLLKTGALLLLLCLMERRPISDSVSRAIRLGLLGFPLTGLYVTKMGILKGLSHFGALPQAGLIILWVVPLLAVWAGEDGSASGRRRMPTYAQLIAVLVAVYVSLEGGLLFSEIIR